MGAKHTHAIEIALREALALWGFTLAISGRRDFVNGRWVQSQYHKEGRIYRSERDKGHPERALHTVTSWNRYTVPDALGAILEQQYNWRLGA